MFKDFSESAAALRGDLPQLERRGISYHPDARPRAYALDEYKTDYGMACDAQPALVSASNAGIPAFLTTLVDPQVYKVLVAPNEMAKIIGETRKGDGVAAAEAEDAISRARAAAEGAGRRGGQVVVNERELSS